MCLIKINIKKIRSDEWFVDPFVIIYPNHRESKHKLIPKLMRTSETFVFISVDF